jgi:hypothetical protein
VAFTIMPHEPARQEQALAVNYSLGNYSLLSYVRAADLATAAGNQQAHQRQFSLRAGLIVCSRCYRARKLPSDRPFRLRVSSVVIIGSARDHRQLRTTRYERPGERAKN